MAEPRVLVLRAAGINCNEETRFGFERAGARADEVHINRLLERPDLLRDYGLVVVPGGFSYGDDIAAGKILAVEIGIALGDHFRAFVDRGRLLLGICNGFQVLVKTGLLPGRTRTGVPVDATLNLNASGRYEDRWVHLEVDPAISVFSPRDRRRIQLPVGHAEGRFMVGDPAQLEALVASHQAVFRYVAEDGSEPGYPENPNGSMGHIAGVSDATGRVLGLMPHPDRALFPWNHPSWTREPPRDKGDGASIFEAALAALR